MNKNKQVVAESTTCMIPHIHIKLSTLSLASASLFCLADSAERVQWRTVAIMDDEHNSDTKDNGTVLLLTKHELGFRPQKDLIYNRLLPYTDKLDAESQAWLTEIKGNLGRAVMLRELKPGCVYWSNMLNMWVTWFFTFLTELRAIRIMTI